MKEFSIEEKAKAYDGALKRARLYYCDEVTQVVRDTVSYIFLELKESEDEQIRKAMIALFKGQIPSTSKEDNKKFVAWLEKQGETYTKKDVDNAYLEGMAFAKDELKKQAEVVSDKDDIEAEEKGIRKAFNKIWEEKQCKQKPFDYKNQGTQNSHKFNIGDIISNGNVEFRIDNIVKNCVGQDCYFLVDVESEKNGTRYLTMCVRGKKTSHMGETTWLCEQVDKSFKKQGEQKPITEMKSAEESLGIDSETYNKIVDECIYGENKPANIVEPKFKVGDWIVFNGLTLYINEVVQGYYRTISKGGITNSYDWDIDNVARLWTIQDAKDGDVLASKDKEDILIYKSHSIIDLLLTSHISFSKKEGFCPRQYSAWDSNEFIPATKEQRDLLFSKMHEAGYEWDADKKELKKISQRMISAEAKEAMYAKPAWSEDDETGLTNTIIMLKEGASLHFIKKDITKAVDWLKSLKERVLPQPKQEWSEEDEHTLQGVIDEIQANKNQAPDYDLATYDRFLSWLKSLKTKVQPKQEWSEKDEEELEIAIDTLKESGRYDSAKWVQSLKRRIGGKL